MTETNIRVRIDAIRHRMLDVAGDLVDEIGHSAAMRAQARAQIAASLYGEIAAFTCRKAACRRAHRCRGEIFACIARAGRGARAQRRPMNQPIASRMTPATAETTACL